MKSTIEDVGSSLIGTGAFLFAVMSVDVFFKSDDLISKAAAAGGALGGSMIAYACLTSGSYFEDKSPYELIKFVYGRAKEYVKERKTL
jgi:hypothetical protein